MSRPGLRRRLFWTLFLAALIPAALTLGAGTLFFREVVASTGSAGPWIAVADSGRELLELIGDRDPDPELLTAAEHHRSVLSESLRLSQVYALLGERIVLLIPAGGLLLLALVAGIAAVATRRLATTLATPAEELALWIRKLGDGEALPALQDDRSGRDIAEFQTLRTGLRDAACRLDEARKQEVEQARARSWADMARRVAHEIKNPLTPMRMAAERVARSSDERAAEAGEVLLEEVARLDRLARAFSQFGRPVDGPPSPVDLTELIRGVERRLAIEGAPIQVQIPERPVVVEGHLDALERIVRNLVSNALEAQELPGAQRPAAYGNHVATGHSASILDDPAQDRPAPDRPQDPDQNQSQAPESPAVEVSLRIEGEDAVITVADRGPGIPEELLKRIWEPDFTTRRRGTGLGLPLVRQAVKHHGGQVQAWNRSGGGAAFQVRLPLSLREGEE